MTDHTPIDYENYAKNMRLELSAPEMILQDGSINHQYFLVKKGAFWGKQHQKALIRGIEIFGIGRWLEIKNFALSNFVREKSLFTKCF